MDTKLMVAGGTFIGLVVGGVAGYFIAREMLEQDYADLAIKEIEDAKVYYNTLYKQGPFETPQKVMQTLRRVPGAALQGLDDSIADEQPDEVVEHLLHKMEYGSWGGDPPRKTMGQPNGGEMKLATRNPMAAYVISDEEFMENDDHTQVTITRYSDGVFVNEQEEPLDNVVELLGTTEIPFGHLSNQPAVAYIRNPKIQMDFEVVVDERSYAEVVGFPKD